MGAMKNIQVLSQHVDPETGASLVAHPESYGEGVSPIPPVDARGGLPNFDRGLGLFRENRGGELVKIGPDKFEFVVNSTIRERYGEGYQYGGQIRMGDKGDVTTLEGGWCQCPSYIKKQYTYHGFTVCKHMWWAAIKAAHGQYEKPVFIEIHHNSGELKAVKINHCKLREAQADIGSFKSWLDGKGFYIYKFPGHGEDVKLDKEDLFMRVYVR